MNLLDDRLDPKTFEEDEVVEVSAVPQRLLPGPIEQNNWKHIPERLWNRLLSLGTGYSCIFHE